MKIGFQSGLITKKDIYVVIHTYEKFIAFPSLIEYVHDLVNPIFSEKEKAYNYLSTIFPQTLFGDVIENIYQEKSKDQRDKDNILYKDLIHLFISLRGKYEWDDELYNEYFKVIAKIRYENNMHPLDLYFEHKSDEIITKEKEILNGVDEIEFDSFTTEIDKFNIKNLFSVNWFLNTYQNDDELHLDMKYEENSKVNSTIEYLKEGIKKNKRDVTEENRNDHLQLHSVSSVNLKNQEERNEEDQSHAKIEQTLQENTKCKCKLKKFTSRIRNRLNKEV